MLENSMRLRRLTEEEMHKNDQVLNHVVYRMFSNNDNSKSGENPMYTTWFST